MDVRAFEHRGLGDRSYLILEPEAHLAAVVDPQRDIAPYLAAAAEVGCRVAYALETHLHNDYLSGARRLAEGHGATVVASAQARLAFPHRAVAAGDVVELGPLRIQVLATPGHTREHLSYSVVGDPPVLFSGGALLPGGAARIDLFGPEEAKALAELARHSVGALLALPGETRVLATHGAGSFCSSGVRRAPETTIADERAQNRFAGCATTDAFLAEAIRDVPPVPRYYARVRERNRLGVEAPPPMPAITHDQLAALLEEGAVTVLDARPEAEYAQSHVRGSFAVPLHGAFGPWVAWLLPEDRPLALVVDRDESGPEGAMQLASVGRDAVAGYVRVRAGQWEPSSHWTHERGRRAKRAVVDVRAHGLPLRRVGRADPNLLQADYDATIVDVRWDAEWQAGHIPYARHIPLDELAARVTELPRESRIAVHCASGYRSVIGVSILERAGLERIAHLPGGIAAWGDSGGLVVS